MKLQRINYAFSTFLGYFFFGGGGGGVSLPPVFGESDTTVFPFFFANPVNK